MKNVTVLTVEHVIFNVIKRAVDKINTITYLDPIYLSIVT